MAPKFLRQTLNPQAVLNAKYNFQKYNIPAKVYYGDMYEPLPPHMKFDFIFWNHPFNRGNNPYEDILLKSGFDYHYASLEKYIAAHNYLNSQGKLLLGTGNFAFIRSGTHCRKVRL